MEKQSDPKEMLMFHGDIPREYSQSGIMGTDHHIREGIQIPNK